MNLIKDDLLKVNYGLLLQGVNASGVMGSGVARLIKEKYPVVYQIFLKSGVGEHMLGTFVPIVINKNLIIGNCYTQHKYGSDGKRYASPKAIELALTAACEYASQNNIDIIAMPKIGAGLGGLDWESEVEPVIEEVANRYKDSITVNVYYID